MTVEEHEAWYDKPKSAHYRAVNWLSKWTGGRIRSSHYYHALDWHDAHDAEEQAECRVPGEEQVTTRVLWAVEFYSPSVIEGFLAALAKLPPKRLGGADQEPEKFVREHRSSPGSSIELYLFPRGGGGFLPSGHECELPEWASSARASIISVTPSLSLMVTGFFLKSDEKTALNRILHTDHPTKLTANRNRSISISSPSLEQKRLVAAQRRTWVEDLTAWHQEHLPGLLSTSGSKVAVAELSTIAGALPLSDRAESKVLAPLDLSWSYLVFEGPSGSAEKPFKLVPGSNGSTPESLTLVASTEEGFRGQEAEHWGKDDESLAAYFDDRFRRTFGLWALPEVLSHYRRYVAKSRDGAAAVIGNKRVARALTKVRLDTAQCIDAETIARELAAAAEQGFFYRDGMDFNAKEVNDPRDATLRAAVKATVKRDAKELLENVADLNRNLQTQANLLSAHANLKLQRLVLWLTVISVVAGGLAAIDPLQRLASQMLHCDASVTPTRACRLLWTEAH